MREQKVVAVSIDIHKERDATPLVADFLRQGWTISSASGTHMKETHLAIVFLLEREASDDVPSATWGRDRS